MFIIELRNANPWRGKDVEGYLGWFKQDGERVFGVVNAEDEAERYPTEAHANAAIRRAPDALFDRYSADVREVE